MMLWKTTGAGLLMGLFGLAFSAQSTSRLPPIPLESPDQAECYEWKYPKNKACGDLSGKTECKSKPTIEASDDQDKKDKCKPKKGDTCTCE